MSYMISPYVLAGKAGCHDGLLVGFVFGHSAGVNAEAVSGEGPGAEKR